MEFVRSNKLPLLVIGVLTVFVLIVIAVIAPRVVASFSPTLTPKSSNAEDYVYLTDKSKAKAPVGPAETSPPVMVVNPMTLIELPGNVELSEISVDTEFGIGVVTLKLTDAAFELYLDEVAELKSSETVFTYDSLHIFEKEAATLTDLAMVHTKLMNMNDGTLPSTVFYQVRAVPALEAGMPTSDNPVTGTFDPDK